MRLGTTTREKRRRNGLLGFIALATSTGVLGCTGPDPYLRFTTRTTLVRCNVAREECQRIGFSNGTTGDYICLERAPGSRIVQGDVCVDPFDPAVTSPATICDQRFCTHDVNAPGTCSVFSAQAVPSALDCAPSSGLTQIKDVSVHSVKVDYDNQSNFTFPGVLGNAVLGTAADPPICVPPNTQPISWVRSQGADVSFARRIGQVIPNSPACTAASSQVVFVVPPAPVGTGTTGTPPVPVGLTALRGHASVGRSCFDEICVLKTLDAFELDLADMTVSGVALRNPRVQLVMPAPLTSIVEPDGPSFLGVAPGALNLRMEAQVNGVDTLFSVTSSTPFRVDTTPAFRLRGTLVVKTPSPNGILTTTMNVDTNGAVAPPGAVACTTQSGLERMFGFEEVQLWSSTTAQLSLVTTPLRQGCGALGVRGQGFMSIFGAPFSTRGLTTNAALSVDLFIPSGQPNPFWTGGLQAHLSCPSGAVFNQYIGQVELTGKPLNQYSTLRFPLPSAVRSSLARPLDDCAFTLSLNVNQTGNTWILDRLRFTP